MKSTLILMLLSSTAFAAPGAWTQFCSSNAGAVSGVAISQDGASFWMTNTALYAPPNTSQTIVRVGSSPFANPLFASFTNNGLDNTWHDNVHQGVTLNKFGAPIMRVQTSGLHNGTSYDRSPYVFWFDTANSTWTASTFPAGEVGHWNGAPREMVIDDNGDLLVCGNNLVLASTDGKNWTTRADALSFVFAPPPYSPLANSKPAWVEGRTTANVPLLNTSSLYWQFGFSRMPWGELFIGGEEGSYIHSLDNGFSWEWFDSVMYQPERDANGYPTYRNPACFALSQLYGAGATKDGEVMFNCDRNYAAGVQHNFFIWSAAGHVVEIQQGLQLTTPHVGNFSRLVTLPSGDTFIATQWGPAGQATPTGHMIDVFKWDGTTWTTITPSGTAFTVAGPNAITTDGTALYLGTSLPNGLFKWTPDTSVGAPPVVSIAGGNSATTCPGTTLNGATGLASVQLSATATAMSGHAMTFQWVSRGPAAVTFEDARALSPKAWFDTPGDYVLNLQATDATNGLRAGASVIVHVHAASGGAAPAITAHPQNAVLLPGSSVSFTVQASGSALRYQWRRNHDDIPGATAATLTFTPSAADDGATFYCLVRNAYGKVVSNCGTLGTAPVIAAVPIDHVVTAGASATMSVAVTGTEPFRWQWRRNGTVIANATSPSYTTNIAGSYTCDVSNLFGSATSGAGVLSNGSASTYTLNVTLGSSLVGGGGGTHNVGTAVPISTEAFAATGYYEVFDKWTATSPSGVSATFANPFSSQTTVTISGANAAGAAVNVYANYKIAAPYYLTVANGAGSTKATQNAVVPIAASAAPPGYIFDKWLGSGIANPNAAQTTVTLTATAQNVTASYVHPITKWKTQSFGANANDPLVAGDLADPDGDGVVNALEYALGTNPLANDTSALPALSVQTIGAQSFLALGFTRSAADVTYTVEVSGNLTQPWTPGSSYSPTGNVLLNAATTDITPQGSPAGYTLVRDNTPLTGASQRFIHLRVTTP